MSTCKFIARSTEDAVQFLCTTEEQCFYQIKLGIKYGGCPAGEWSISPVDIDLKFFPRGKIVLFQEDGSETVTLYPLPTTEGA